MISVVARSYPTSSVRARFRQPPRLLLGSRQRSRAASVVVGATGQLLGQPPVVLGRVGPDLGRLGAAVDRDRLRVVGGRALEQEAGVAAAGAEGEPAPLDQRGADAKLRQPAQQADTGD